jgi:hypothetical protein
MSEAHQLHPTPVLVIAFFVLSGRPALTTRYLSSRRWSIAPGCNAGTSDAYWGLDRFKPAKERSSLDGTIDYTRVYLAMSHQRIRHHSSASVLACSCPRGAGSPSPILKATIGG